MHRIITVAVIALALVACESEGINRNNTDNQQIVNGVESNAPTISAPNDGTNNGSLVTDTGAGADPIGGGNSSDNMQVIVVTPPTQNQNTGNNGTGSASDNDATGTGTGTGTPTDTADDVNMFGGSGSSNGPTTSDDDVNMFGGSGSSNGPTTSDDDVNMFGGSGSSNGPTTSDDDVNMFGGSGSSNGPTTSDDDVNMFGGSGSSNGPTTSDDDVNMFGGSGSSNGPTTSDDDVNMFGGSGSSNGPSDDDPIADGSDTETNTGNTGSTGNFGTDAPSGTTFVSTMSPVRSESGPLCLSPQKDANGNVIMNGNGCPQLQYHGQLKFGDFMLSTNAWNFCASSSPDWQQCVSVNSNSGSVAPRWDYDWGHESEVNGAVWLVKSYPEIIYGIKSPGEYSGNSLQDAKQTTGLPAKVSELPYYRIDYTFSSDEYNTHSKPFNNQTLNGERNVAIESFFHELDSDCSPGSLIRNGNTSNQRYEIMVWLDAGAERLPAGPNDYVTTVSLDGTQFDVYTKPSDIEYIAFVSKSPRTSGSINWTTFIDWSRANAHRVNQLFGRGSNTVRIQDDWCLANILLGTEIWWGEGYFQADEWTIHRTEN